MAIQYQSLKDKETTVHMKSTTAYYKLNEKEVIVIRLKNKIDSTQNSILSFSVIPAKLIIIEQNDRELTRKETIDLIAEYYLMSNDVLMYKALARSIYDKLIKEEAKSNISYQAFMSTIKDTH